MCRSKTVIENYLVWTTSLFILFINSTVWAHDPVFGIGPHVLFKGGVDP